jgi:hypothetical protein
MSAITYKKQKCNLAIKEDRCRLPFLSFSSADGGVFWIFESSVAGVDSTIQFRMTLFGQTSNIDE